MSRKRSPDDPEQRVLRVRQAHRAREVLQQLPDAQREILLLRTVGGLSARETAEVLDMTTDAVQLAQHQALRQFRAKLLARPELRRRTAGNGPERVPAG